MGIIVRELAEELKTSVQTIYNHMKKLNIKTEKVSGIGYIKDSDVEAIKKSFYKTNPMKDRTEPDKVEDSEKLYESLLDQNKALLSQLDKKDDQIDVLNETIRALNKRLEESNLLLAHQIKLRETESLETREAKEEKEKQTLLSRFKTIFKK